MGYLSAARTVAVVGVPWSEHELRVAAAAAARLDAELLLVDTRAELAGVEPGIRSLAVPELEPKHVARVLDGIELDAVLSITELHMATAARVREVLGLRGTPAAAESAVMDKWATRELLRRGGLTGVDYRLTSLARLDATLAELPRPVVVKPRAFTGSHAVRLLSDGSDGRAGLETAFAASHDPLADDVLVETFLAGDEISAEALVVDGRLHLLALTDKFTTAPPTFFEVGHVMPSRHSYFSPRVAEYLQAICDELRVVTSAIHAELKLGEGDALDVVELHLRFGGGSIVRLLAEAYGVDAFECLLAAVLDGTVPPTRDPVGVAGVGFLGAPIDAPARLGRLVFPFPECIRLLDFDASRSPKVREHADVRLEYWRFGQVRSFGAYEQVVANVLAVVECFEEALREPGAARSERFADCPAA